MSNLSERYNTYEKAYTYLFTRKLPVILNVSGKSFGRLTKLLTKPCSVELCKIFAESLIYTATELQGCQFAFTFGDEAIFVLTNDQTEDTEPWLDNKIQDMVTITSSIFTTAFHKNDMALDLDLPFLGDPIFRVHGFTLPNYTEVISYLSWKQIIAYKQAVNDAALKELEVKFSPQKAEDMIYNKSVEEKKELLKKHCGTSFDDFYPSYWYHGIGAYRMEVPLSSDKDAPVRTKWSINWELPFFMKSKELLTNIFALN